MLIALIMVGDYRLADNATLATISTATQDTDLRTQTIVMEAHCRGATYAKLADK